MLSIALLYGITFADQFTKELVLRNMEYGSRIVIVPGIFNLCHVRNTGAAWGMLANSQFLLIAVAVGMLVFLLLQGRTMFDRVPGGPVYLGLLSAGIAGNLIDRIRLGYVVDFIDVYWKDHHFPSFNVADSAIFLGVVAYIVSHHITTRRGGVRETPARSDVTPTLADEGDAR